MLKTPVLFHCHVTSHSQWSFMHDHYRSHFPGFLKVILWFPIDLQGYCWCSIFTRGIDAIPDAQSSVSSVLCVYYLVVLWLTVTAQLIAWKDSSRSDLYVSGGSDIKLCLLFHNFTIGYLQWSWIDAASLAMFVFLLWTCCTLVMPVLLYIYTVFGKNKPLYTFS